MAFNNHVQYKQSASLTQFIYIYTQQINKNASNNTVQFYIDLYTAQIYYIVYLISNSNKVLFELQRDSIRELINCKKCFQQHCTVLHRSLYSSNILQLTLSLIRIRCYSNYIEIRLER